MYGIRKRIGYALACLLVLSHPAAAQDKMFTLAVPDALEQSGLLGHILPRFSLKTGTRITTVPPAETADASFGNDGRPAFEGLGQVWHISVGEDQDALRFAEWLRSDVGRRTVDSYTVDGSAPFASEVKVETVVVTIDYDGDAKRGEQASMTHCGRCHVINDSNRMNAIGSTPSFGVLRTLGDWDTRFQSFYVLNPHPAFTQIVDVTAPFDPMRPSPIHPVSMTLEDLDNILAYVQGIPPADLGAPVQSMSE